MESFDYPDDHKSSCAWSIDSSQVRRELIDSISNLISYYGYLTVIIVLCRGRKHKMNNIKYIVYKVNILHSYETIIYFRTLSFLF
jgi:hypothetical protein